MDTKLDRALVIFVGVVCTPVGWILIRPILRFLLT